MDWPVSKTFDRFEKLILIKSSKIKVQKFLDNFLKFVSFRMDQDKSEKKPPPGLRPCCACKETKKVRDECFLGSGRTI